MTNILSVDVEDYFQVQAFSGQVHRSLWDTYSSRVEANTLQLLDLFDELAVNATFFILGWVAERYPALVKQIVARGHELACHSYWHRPIFELSPDEFREDTRKAKDIIEQIGGIKVTGYRAPSFSIMVKSFWALDILAELEFSYDSSIFPVRHDFYGVPNAPRTPFVINTESGPLIEYPMTTFSLGKRLNLPVGGGGYLRIFPEWYTRFGVNQVWKEQRPMIIYVHPWEVDPEQPRLAGPLKSRLRHYTNLAKTKQRLSKLIQSGSFSSFQNSGLAAGATPYDIRGVNQ